MPSGPAAALLLFVTQALQLPLSSSNHSQAVDIQVNTEELLLASPAIKVTYNLCLGHGGHFHNGIGVIY